MTFECALAISIRPLLGDWSGTGACVSLASLSVQARVVLVVPVFAQPHGAGASPGEAVASPKPWTVFVGDGTNSAELQSCCCFLHASSHSESPCRCFCIFCVFVYGHLLPSLAKDWLRLFPVQTGMVVLGVWLIFRSMEESSFYSQMPFHQNHMVTSLLPKPLFPSPVECWDRLCIPCPIPASAQCQVEWGFDQPGLAEDVSAHSKGLKQNDL